MTLYSLFLVESSTVVSFVVLYVVVFFFFKQKTAYEMRISDWSSDVCSSDLRPVAQEQHRAHFRNGEIYRCRSDHRLDPRVRFQDTRECGLCKHQSSEALLDGFAEDGADCE